MKSFRFLLTFVTVSLAAVATVSVPAAAAEHEHHTPLEDQMEKMGGAMRRLKTAVADPAKTAEAIQLVAKIKAGAEEAKGLTPALAAEQPEAARAAFVAGYQKKMGELLASLGELETALKAGDLVAAKKSFDGLRDLQKSGHHDYKKPDEKRPAPAAGAPATPASH